MLAAEDGVPYSFEQGAEPEPLVAAGPSIQSEDGVGGIASLPNGLSHEVFGYLPYWALSSSLRQYLRYDLVSSIAYFSVPVNADGTLSSSGQGWSGWASADMTDVINRAHARGVRVLLTVTMMAWDGNYTSMSGLLDHAVGCLGGRGRRGGGGIIGPHRRCSEHEQQGERDGDGARIWALHRPEATWVWWSPE
jgi:hypothetical protein